MTAQPARNGFDRLGRLRRLSTPLEVAQIERFGTSALALLFRTDVVVLHSTGRRSGLERTTPLACTPDPLAMGRDHVLLVVGGAGGQARVPDWAANLRAHPRAAVTHRRRRLDVVAEQLEGEERTLLWAHLARVWPRITVYERRAGRAVPVFRLTPTEHSS